MGVTDSQIDEMLIRHSSPVFGFGEQGGLLDPVKLSSFSEGPELVIYY